MVKNNINIFYERVFILKELKLKKQSNLKNCFKGKGFYLSLVISLSLIGTTIWVAMNKSIDNVIDKNVNIIEKFNEKANLKSVDNIIDDVPIEKKATNHHYLRSLNDEKETKDDDVKGDDIKDVRSDVKDESQNDLKEKTSESEGEDSILFVPPIVGKVINEFSNYELVKDKTLSDWRVHNGVDIAAAQGTPVKAIADGEVIKIYNDPMLGVCIEIEHHGNINSTYCGLNKNVNVKEGDNVEAGDVIASVGDTAIGEAELETHLHLEVKKDGVKIDPLSKIKVS